jgi:hypothetical protein
MFAAPSTAGCRCRALPILRAIHILYEMLSRRAILLAAVLLATATTIGCGTPPQKEMDEARAAVEAARAAGAAQLAPADFSEAADALARSEAAVAQRDYRLALNEALDARARAGDAVTAATAKAAALRAEAERAVTDIAAAVDRLKDAIAKAESSRTPRPNRKAISDARRTIVVANVALQEAREALGRKDYTEAGSKCGAVMDQLNSAMTALVKPPTPPATAQPR